MAIGSPVAFTDSVNYCVTPLAVAHDLVNGGRYLTGQLADVRVYNKVLGSNDLFAIYNTDSIGDGIPDWWRALYFGNGTTTNSSSCASCDPTGNGFSNLQEYMAGRNPLQVFNEWYGPHNSWTNIEAFRNGTNSDTTTVSNALLAVGQNGCSPVLYATQVYQIAKSLLLQNAIDIEIVNGNTNNAVAGFKWIGGTDTNICGTNTLFHFNGNTECKIKRLLFDGGGNAFTIIDHSMSITGTRMDQGNVWEDCIFTNAAPHGFGVVGGYFNGSTNMPVGALTNLTGKGFANNTFLRCKFNGFENAVYTGNQNALDCWVTQSYVSDCATGLNMQAGSIHAYQSVFSNNTVDIFLRNSINFVSAVGNISIRAGSFFYVFDEGANSSTPILLKGNTVIDSTGTPVYVDERGSIIVMDNTFAYTNGVAVSFPGPDGTSTDAILLGNTNCSTPWFSFGNAGYTNLVDNVTVTRSSLALTLPPMPVMATNLGRAIVEMPTNCTVASIQSAINGATDGAVIHFPTALYVNNPSFPHQIALFGTITLPTNKYIVIEGDGCSTKLGGENNGQTLFSAPWPSHATFADIDLFGNGNDGAMLQVSGVSSTSARVYIHDSNIQAGTFANIDLGNCSNTVIEERGFGCGATYNDGWTSQSNGVKYLCEGAGTLRVFDTDSGDNVIGFVVTNGGNVYVETQYNEASPSPPWQNKIFLVSGNSLLTFLSGTQHENISNDDETWQYASTNGFTVSNLTGQATMALISGIIDWTVVKGTNSGSFWIVGDSTTVSPQTNTWPIVNSTAFVPVQTMNWNATANAVMTYPDVNTNSVSATYVRTMLAPARSTFADSQPMVRRPGQTDVLIDNARLEGGGWNIQVTP